MTLYAKWTNSSGSQTTTTTPAATAQQTTKATPAGHPVPDRGSHHRSPGYHNCRRRRTEPDPGPGAGLRNAAWPDRCGSPPPAEKLTGVTLPDTFFLQNRKHAALPGDTTKILNRVF